MPDLLPPNATPAERAIAEAVGRISDVPVIVRQMASPSEVPAALLPWMAWAFSVDQWDSNWTEAQKRATVAAAASIHKSKGTLGALTAALAPLGISVEVVEWFDMEPPGEPYTFSVALYAGDTGWTAEQLARLLQVVDANKNLRSHLVNVIPQVGARGTLYGAGVAVMGQEITISFGG